MADDRRDREDHAAAGEVSVEEARKILSMFNSSHFHNHAPGPHGRAVYSIPADPSRDSDIRLGAFISRAEKAFAELDRLRVELAASRDLHDEHCGNEGPPCIPPWGRS